MKPFITSHLNRVLTLILTIIALVMGQNTWADNGWDIQTNTSGNVTTFTITRTNTAVAETVRYRLVNLSAYAMQHYYVSKINGEDADLTVPVMNLRGEFTFTAGETKSRTITVTEQTANNDAYLYQTGTERSYKLEVTDIGGFLLAEKTRSFKTGTNISDNIFRIRDITIQSDEYKNTDAGYENNNVKSVASSSYFDYVAPRTYFQHIGAELRMTLTMDVREQNDGYQYMSILTSKTLFDNRSGCSNGDPGNINNSLYMAGFEHKTNGKDTEYKSYSFPVTSVSDNEGHSNPWGHGTQYILSKQKFNTNRRASDGRLILPLDFDYLAVRCNASGGGTDHDEWWAKNVKAHIQAVDATAPSVLAGFVAPGKHAAGNTMYVSLAFNEIVKVTGTPTLNTANGWGTLSYVAGSGSNVLTFSGIIGDNALGYLTITGWSGTITDLAGNAPSSITYNSNCERDASYAYSIGYSLNGGQNPGNPSKYTYDTETFTLNAPTRTGYTFAGWTGSNGDTPETTVQISKHSYGKKSFTAHWTANHYTVHFDANATNGINATGSMDDQTFTYDESQALTKNTFTRPGYTFAGWNTKSDGTGTSYADGYKLNNLSATNNGTVTLYAKWNVINWTGNGQDMNHAYMIEYPSQLIKLSEDVAGGNKYVSFCFKLKNDIDMQGVTFNGIGDNDHSFQGRFNGNGKAIRNLTINRPSSNYVGLFGYVTSEYASVKNLTIDGADIIGNNYVSAIVGYNSSTIENCLVKNSSVKAKASDALAGVYVGHNNSSNNTLNKDYYINCTRKIGNATNSSTNIGTGDGDIKGIHSLHTITMDDDRISASGETLVLDNVTYYASNTTVMLSCSGVPEGYSCAYSTNKGASINSSFSMPAENIRIYVSMAPDFWRWWHADADHDGTTEDRAYIIRTATGINLLANLVSQGNTYKNKFFKLEHDIKYDPNNLDENGENYTPIGNFYHNFQGTFDGQGYTISGIRLKKMGDNNTQNGKQGIFGVIMDATIKNVVLNDAIITGCNQVGGIVGDTSSKNTIENCLVLNSEINNTSGTQCGAILGMYSSNVTLANNYYYHCTVNGKTTNIGTYQGDKPTNNGALCVYTMTRQRNIRAAAQPILNYRETNYYLPGTPVKLSHVDGFNMTAYTVKDANDNDIALTNGNTFETPASDVTITADLTAIPWDGDGRRINPFVIEYPSQLDLLAKKTIGLDGFEPNYFAGTYFILKNDIRYDPEDLDAEGKNYTPIGNNTRPFAGIFEGNGHTISGIRVARRGNTNDDSYLGLFGNVISGEIRNVILNDARFFGYSNIGSFVGRGVTTLIKNCYTTDSVFVWAGYNGSQCLGGIAGYLFDSKIEGCINFAQVKDNANSNCKYFGGIVGYESLSAISHNTVIESTIAASSYVGAISGCTEDFSHLNNNYYYGAKVIKNANSTWDGIGNGGIGLSGGFADITDNDGAVKANGIPLSDDHKNTFILRKYYKDEKGSRSFTLTGRRFIVSDKTWNTVCLPFSISESAMKNNTAHLFNDAIVMEMDPDETTLDNGVLRLAFKQTKSIQAGKPYLIKVVNHLYQPNTSPTFNNGYISVVEPEAVTSNDGTVTFVGQFDPFVVSDGRNDEDYNPTPNNINDIVMLGNNNTLGYSKNPRTLHTFRCHFYVSSGSDKARDFELNFDDGEITSATDTEMVVEFKLDNWYTLDGKKLDGEPTEKGVYIYKGKKVIKK
ncbi:InlB B-repeat-containing protein [Prevotella sp. E15-22]|uniref:InlB B-repeat-containing protein n=1 Tax=Prevotella sp. E15-22 TaxID=2937774 RepID=UPI002068B31A|nr:InlB B-repeat-containing protein [Prevotella sp. E15-22]UPS44403.1 InlB B-repeat-containing protein [Prevotella sp. E15-22]